MTVAAFMSQVGMLHFSRAGTSHYGTPASPSDTMAPAFNSVQLTRPQRSSAIIPMQEYIKLLNKEAAENPQGGEHEGILVAESVLREMIRAKNATRSG